MLVTPGYEPGVLDLLICDGSPAETDVVSDLCGGPSNPIHDPDGPCSLFERERAGPDQEVGWPRVGGIPEGTTRRRHPSSSTNCPARYSSPRSVPSSSSCTGKTTEEPWPPSAAGVGCCGVPSAGTWPPPHPAITIISTMTRTSPKAAQLGQTPDQLDPEVAEVLFDATPLKVASSPCDL